MHDGLHVPAERPLAATTQLASLSPRELEVLETTARGLTNAEVARQLGVTVHAVKFHLASIYRRLGVSNRTQAALVFADSSRGTGRDAGERH